MFVAFTPHFSPLHSPVNNSSSFILLRLAPFQSFTSITIHRRSHLAAYIKLALKPSLPWESADFIRPGSDENLQAVGRLEQESQTPIWQACPLRRSTFKILFFPQAHTSWLDLLMCLQTCMQTMWTTAHMNCRGVSNLKTERSPSYKSSVLWIKLTSRWELEFEHLKIPMGRIYIFLVAQ